MSAAKEQGETSGRRNRSRHSDPPERPAASVNLDELRELIALLRENGLAELELENEGFRVRLRRDTGVTESAPVASALPPAPASDKSPAPAPTSSGPSHPGTQA